MLQTPDEDTSYYIEGQSEGLSLGALHSLLLNKPILKSRFVKEVQNAVFLPIEYAENDKWSPPKNTVLAEFNYSHFFPDWKSYLYDESIQTVNRAKIFKEYTIVVPSRPQYDKVRGLFEAGEAKVELYDMESISTRDSVNETKHMMEFCKKLSGIVMIMKSRTKSGEFEKFCFQVIRQVVKKLKLKYFSMSRVEVVIKNGGPLESIGEIVNDEDCEDSGGLEANIDKSTEIGKDTIKESKPEEKKGGEVQILADSGIKTEANTQSKRRKFRRKRVTNAFDIMTEGGSGPSQSPSVAGSLNEFSDDINVMPPNSIPIQVIESINEIVKVGKGGKDQIPETIVEEQFQNVVEKRSGEEGLEEGNARGEQEIARIEVESSLPESEHSSHQSANNKDFHEIQASSSKEIDSESKILSDNETSKRVNKRGRSEANKSIIKRKKPTQSQTEIHSSLAFIEALEKAKVEEDKKFQSEHQETVSKKESEAVRKNLKVGTAPMKISNITTNRVNKPTEGRNFKRFIKRRKGDGVNAIESFYRTYVALEEYKKGNSEKITKDPTPEISESQKLFFDEKENEEEIESEEVIQKNDEEVEDEPESDSIDDRQIPKFRFSS